MTRQVETWAAATADRYPTLASTIFIDGDSFLALAMKAYLAAGHKMVPPNGGRWLVEDDPWGNARDFFEALTFQIAERLRLHALQTGHLSERPWSEDEEREHEDFLEELAGAGRSPAVTALVPADRFAEARARGQRAARRA
ncbi:hypothetical protein LVB87_12235 [Lysobacter sp. KIS68-7]|uniref:hypothetical protein n=1 Tax=Lysobacter sp. KIS68-7 TaxID=2904252 RepID=UPI001E4AA9EC|nr:hypothetical protein [Lysobacter sp. KIS68-7]UHQ18947.1 hypothetical protein LVB87_12235 [Lysobacter sp. KIS68-7]